MDGFSPRDGAPLDYWFWKFHVGDLAFLVDIIVRRRTGRAETRVSQWLRGTGRVVHAESTDWVAAPDKVRVSTTELRPRRSVGAAEDIFWDLTWTDGSVVVNPLLGPLAKVQPFDMSILNWPLTRFTWSVQIGSERFDVNDTPGAFYHYWGRRLMDRWVWLSATLFEDAPTRRLETVVDARTHLFGRIPNPVPLSFLWTADGDRLDLVVSTFNGLVRSRPVEGGIAIDAQRLGRPRHRVAATWGSVQANDIGEGIVQTMHGDVSLDGFRAVRGTVGLETRGWPSHTEGRVPGVEPSVPVR